MMIDITKELDIMDENSNNVINLKEPPRIQSNNKQREYLNHSVNLNYQCRKHDIISEHKPSMEEIQEINPIL